MRALAAEQQQLNQQLRQSQKEFARKLQSSSSVTDDSNTNSLADIVEAADQDKLSQQQQQALATADRAFSERERELLRLAQSVNELSQLFRELNVLVIEQGTLLDRIDYNLEQAQTHVKSGVVELEEANRISKKMRTIKVIICLLLVLALLITIFSWKVSR